MPSFVCLQIDDGLTAGAVERACSAGSSSSLLSTLKFQVSITNMYLSNANVDLTFMMSPKHHFDDEKFQEGRDIIIAGPSDWFYFTQNTAADLLTFPLFSAGIFVLFQV